VGSGWILDRVRFEATLQVEAEAAGVVLCRRTKVKSVFQRNEYWIVNSHRFLVDATGRAAILARGMGARCLYFDRLTAVYAVFSAFATLSPDRMAPCAISTYALVRDSPFPVVSV
jgi:flavin-dependent dehydrogenase